MSVATAPEVVVGTAHRQTYSLEATERRRAARLDCPPLFVDGLSAVVQDVSRSGIALLVDHPVRQGEVYRLTLTDAIDESFETLQAEVVWYHSKKAGLRWCNLSLEQELWLGQRFKAWLGALVGASRR
jgi:hypothetical protein